MYSDGMKKLITGTIIAVVVAGSATAVLASDKNDHVLHEDQYQEYFKQEGNGDKNYLYTVTGFNDQFGRVCTVVTGDSEQTIALDCDFKKG